jgi:hypothetical protein
MDSRERDAGISARFPPAGRSVEQRYVGQQILLQTSCGFGAPPQIFGESRRLIGGCSAGEFTRRRVGCGSPVWLMFLRHVTPFEVLISENS